MSESTSDSTSASESEPTLDIRGEEEDEPSVVIREEGDDDEPTAGIRENDDDDDEEDGGTTTGGGNTPSDGIRSFETSGGVGAGYQTGSTPRTGDDANPILHGAAMTASAVALAQVLRDAKKRRQQELDENGEGQS